jgi:serine/threonine protein kinase
MTPERWRQVDQLYNSALEREPGRRGDFLAEACAGDEELRREVESLLAQEGSKLDRPAWDGAADLLDDPTQAQLVPGTQLGPYRIEAVIGAGGMGVVYRAHDSRLNRDVAIKVSKAQFTERFIREARAIAALKHTNICHLYDVGPDYLVMEYVEGPNLRGSLDFDDALPIIRQLIDGIQAAHEKNIVHRDLKPTNIKITPEGVVKILDFGLAKSVESRLPTDGKPEDSPTLTIGATQAGAVLGTAAYMSPEQAKGKAADQRSDIWSFGVVVYELLAGRRPFEGDTTVETLGLVLNKEPDWTPVPERARRLLQRCLQKDRKQRLGSISDARWMLDEESPVPVGTSPTRQPWLWPFIAALVTVVTGGLGFWLSPLREIVSHKIYHEKALILLTTDSARIFEGSTVQLRIVVTPESAIHVDKGVLRIFVDAQLLRSRAGPMTLPSPVIDAPTVLPEGGPVEFLAIAPGTAKIEVQLQTKYGTYAASNRIVIEQAQVTDEVTKANFTGLWHLRLGNAQGKMEIHQQGHLTITGSYSLDNGDTGVFDGGRDGDRFWGTFTRGASVTKWIVEGADIVTTQGYLELKGTAYLQRALQNGWARAGADNEFYATVAVR